MIKINLLILIISNLIFLVHSSILKLQCKISQGVYSIILYTGTSLNSGTFIIDMESSVSLKSPSNNVEIYIDGLYNEQIELLLEDRAINIPNFYFQSKPFFINYDSLSFTFLYQKSYTSLIETLYQNKEIEKRIFGFSSNLSNKNYFYLGGIPDELVINNYLHEFKVVSGYKTWGFQLNEVCINMINFCYQNEYYSFFNSNSKYIEVPKKFYNLLYEKVFLKFINEKKCNPNDEGFMVCDQKVTNSIGAFTFEISKKIIKLNNNKLFQCINDNKCTFLIKENHIDKWEFGVSFMQHFSIFFDYDNKVISLFSRERFLNFNNENKIKIIISYIATIEAIFGLMMLAFSVYKLKHERLIKNI